LQAMFSGVGHARPAGYALDSGPVRWRSWRFAKKLSQLRMKISLRIPHRHHRPQRHDPVPRPPKIRLPTMHQRARLRHALKRINPAEPVPFSLMRMSHRLSVEKARTLLHDRSVHRHLITITAQALQRHASSNHPRHAATAASRRKRNAPSARSPQDAPATPRRNASHGETAR